MPNTLFAGRIDYSNLSLEEMKITVLFTICLLTVSAIIGIIAWGRYLRSYQPRRGAFSPYQVLFIVLSLIATAVAFGLFQLRLF